MSGGRATLLSRKVLNRRTGLANNNKAKFSAHSGDIAATHRLGHLLMELFVVECKHYNDSVGWQALVVGGTGKITRWWTQVLEAAAHGDGNRHPLLIIKQNHVAELVCTTAAGYNELRKAGQVRRTAHYPRHDIHVILLRDLLMTDFNKLRITYETRTRVLRK